MPLSDDEARAISEQLESVLNYLTGDIQELNKDLTKILVEQENTKEQTDGLKGTVNKHEARIQKVESAVDSLPSRERVNDIVDNFRERLSKRPTRGEMFGWLGAVASILGVVFTVLKMFL